MGPPLLAAIGIGASAVGAGVGAIGSLSAGNAQSQMYQYQAGVAQQNQQIAQQNAEFSLVTGEQQALTSGQGTRATTGAIRSAQAASGFNINAGTAPDVPAGEHLIGEEAQTQIRSNAAQAAYGYDVSATQYQNQAAIDKFQASQAKTAGAIGAISSIIGGAGSVSTKWLQASTEGIGASGGTVGVLTGS